MRIALALALASALLGSTGCNSSKGAKAGSEDPCHPAPPVRCEQDSECAPYRCKTTFCDKTCTSSTTCIPGFVCSEGACVKAGTCGSCSGDYDCPTGKKCDLGAGACR
jgi:hypothetical protein